MKLKIQYIVMQDSQWRPAGDELYRFDTYEEAEKKILDMIDNLQGFITGSAPSYWIKKVFTV